MNVSSGHGRQPSAINVDYGAAKAAMINLTKALSEEFGAQGVRVNGVCPGPAKTPWWTDEGGAADIIAGSDGSCCPMGTRERFEPGTFSWCDLGTTDPEAAKAFYQGLLGWDHEDVPVGEGQVYTMARVDGRSVAAIYGQPDAQREAGIPPAWLSYVTVEDADATAVRAAELGGTVMLPPFDVMEAGRMAVVFDPQGAAFAVWQPKDSIGAELVNAPGAICWNQLSTTDTDAARAFYADLFGWTDEGVEGSEVPYWTLKNGDAMNGGLMPLDPASGVPPHWLTVFAAEDVDAASSGAGELGGQVALPAMDVPEGRFAVVVDPQGAAIGLFAGRLDT